MDSSCSPVSPFVGKYCSSISGPEVKRKFFLICTVLAIFASLYTHTPKRGALEHYRYILDSTVEELIDYESYQNYDYGRVFDQLSEVGKGYRSGVLGMELMIMCVSTIRIRQVLLIFCYS